METLETKSKLKSRKFIVWVVWLLICLIILGVSIINDKVSTEIIKDTLGNFFFISIAYLGLNVGQKGIFAMKDIKETQK